MATSEERFKYSKQGAPGPGEYPSKEVMESTGNYFVSKYGSSGAQRFGKGGREPVVPKHVVPSNPGPGAYSMPSEFGFYEVSDPPAKMGTTGFK